MCRTTLSSNGHPKTLFLTKIFAIKGLSDEHSFLEEIMHNPGNNSKTVRLNTGAKFFGAKWRRIFNMTANWNAQPWNWIQDYTVNTGAKVFVHSPRAESAVQYEYHSRNHIREVKKKLRTHSFRKDQKFLKSIVHKSAHSFLGERSKVLKVHSS